jgi:hypothetical protein
MLEFDPMSDPLNIPAEKRPYTHAVMNRHENTYRRSGRWVVVTFLLWVACMVVFAVHPPKGENYQSSSTIYACVFGIVLVAMMVVSVVRMVAYFRWTGKYPYYFLFRKSRRSDEPETKPQVHR